MRRKIYKSVNVLRKVWRNITDRDLVKLVAVIGTVWILVDFCWTAVNIFDYYTGKNNLEGNRVLWIIVGVLPLTIAAFYFRIIDKNRKLENQNRRLYLQNEEIIRFYRNIIEECIDDLYQNHKEVFFKDIKEAYAKENWEQVIQLGKFGSRLFLMLAKYDLRIKYGRYIVEAAQKIGRPESTAMGHIDCIGWSYVCKGEYTEAKKEIDLGLEFVGSRSDAESNIMKCKAYRHLVGIALRENNLKEAKKNRDAFEKYLRKLKGRDKQIMKASLDIINGDILEQEGENYEKAKENYTNAFQKYVACNDTERAVKVKYKLGRINEKMGQREFALKNYLMGFWLADKISRIDEKLKNCKEICRMLSQRQDVISQVMYDAELTEFIDEYSITSWEKENKFYEEELKKLNQKIHI